MSEWKRVPGFSRYEASDQGQVRNSRAGNVLAVQTSNRGYALIKMVSDKGRRETLTLHSVILTTFVGPRPDGLEACHENDDPLDNCLLNLRWGTHEENVDDRKRNRPAQPKQQTVKQCILCGADFTGNGRRCPPCIVQIGQQAAKLLADGIDMEAVAEELAYPNPLGVVRLAVKHGNLRFVIAEDGASPVATHSDGQGGGRGKLATLVAPFGRAFPGRRLRHYDK